MSRNQIMLESFLKQSTVIEQAVQVQAIRLTFPSTVGECTEISKLPKDNHAVGYIID